MNRESIVVSALAEARRVIEEHKALALDYQIRRALSENAYGLGEFGGIFKDVAHALHGKRVVTEQEVRDALDELVMAGLVETQMVSKFDAEKSGGRVLAGRYWFVKPEARVEVRR